MGLNKITEQIIGVAIAVHRELGPGLLRKVRRGWKPLLQKITNFSWFQGVPEGREQLLESTHVACLAFERNMEARPANKLQRAGIKARCTQENSITSLFSVYSVPLW